MIDVKNLLTRLKWNYKSVDNLSCIKRLLKTLMGSPRDLGDIAKAYSHARFGDLAYRKKLLSQIQIKQKAEIFCHKHLSYRVAVVLSVQAACKSFHSRAHVDDHLKLRPSEILTNNNIGHWPSKTLVFCNTNHL